MTNDLQADLDAANWAIDEYERERATPRVTVRNCDPDCAKCAEVEATR